VGQRLTKIRTVADLTKFVRLVVDLEQKIRQVKHAYAETVHAVAETQVDAHSEICEGNIDAIDVIHHVDEEHERKQTKRNSPSRSRARFWQV
jgi:hypothetical protein